MPASGSTSAISVDISRLTLAPPGPAPASSPSPAPASLATRQPPLPLWPQPCGTATTPCLTSVGQHRRELDLAMGGGDPHAVALGDAERLGIGRVDPRRLRAAATVEQRRVVHPRVLRAQLAHADQPQREAGVRRRARRAARSPRRSRAHRGAPCDPRARRSSRERPGLEVGGDDDAARMLIEQLLQVEAAAAQAEAVAAAAHPDDRVGEPHRRAGGAAQRAEHALGGAERAQLCARSGNPAEQVVDHRPTPRAPRPRAGRPRALPAGTASSRASGRGAGSRRARTSSSPAARSRRARWSRSRRGRSRPSARADPSPPRARRRWGPRAPDCRRRGPAPGSDPRPGVVISFAMTAAGIVPSTEGKSPMRERLAPVLTMRPSAAFVARRSPGAPSVPNIEPPSRSRLPATTLTASSRKVVRVPLRPRQVPVRP